MATTALTDLPTVRRSNRVLTFEFTGDYRVYSGPEPDDADRRVRLEDGTAVHVLRGGPCEPSYILARVAIAVDAGGNVLQERSAEDGPTDGLAAGFPETWNAKVVAKEGEVVGCLEWRGLDGRVYV